MASPMLTTQILRLLGLDIKYLLGRLQRSRLDPTNLPNFNFGGDALPQQMLTQFGTLFSGLTQSINSLWDDIKASNDRASSSNSYQFDDYDDYEEYDDYYDPCDTRYKDLFNLGGIK